jgi:hypothetical protein
MNRLLTLALTGLLTLWIVPPAQAENGMSDLIMPGVDSDLSEFLWVSRPIVVFADTPADPRFIDQMAMLTAEIERLKVRDVVVLTDTDPTAQSALRARLRPRGFTLVLVGKDGGVKLRKPAPRSVREITRVIDNLPTRLREVRERRGTSG